MQTFLAIIGVIVLVIGLMAFFSLLSGFVLMLAWNLVMPALFGLPALGFWQAFAIMVLISIVGSAFKTTVTKS